MRQEGCMKKSKTQEWNKSSPLAKFDALDGVCQCKSTFENILVAFSCHVSWPCTFYTTLKTSRDTTPLFPYVCHHGMCLNGILSSSHPITPNCFFHHIPKQEIANKKCSTNIQMKPLNQLYCLQNPPKPGPTPTATAKRPPVCNLGLISLL